MTERFAVSPGATETYWDYTARLRVDLAEFQKERASPLTQPLRRVVIDRWIAVIEQSSSSSVRGQLRSGIGA